jgi:malate/lactate dehydrogenase
MLMRDADMACWLDVQVAERTGTPVSEVKNVIIWGNHSSSQYPDVAHGTVAGKPITEAVADDAWLKGDFITTVQQRGAAIIKVPTFSPASEHCSRQLFDRP